jgi:hypothetical protein
MGRSQNPAIRFEQINLALHRNAGKFLWEEGLGWNFNRLRGKISQDGSEYDIEFRVGAVIPGGDHLGYQGEYNAATRIFTLKVIEQLDGSSPRECSVRFRIDNEGKVSFVPQE